LAFGRARTASRLLSGGANDSRERAHQSRRRYAELFNALPGKTRKYLFRAGRQVQDHLPAVRTRPFPSEQLLALKPVHHLHGAVMTKLHALGKFANRGRAAGRKSAHRQQEQVLLRLKASAASRLLAPVQELPDLMTEFPERPEFSRAHRFGHLKHYIVLR
jgi:hypothetical protein